MGCINRAYLESSAHSFEMQLQKQEMSLSLEVVKKLKVISTIFILNRDTLIFINIDGSNKESTCSKSSSWLGLTDPLWDTGKKENIFSAEEFSLSCFCLSHNKFEKHSLLWPVTIIQFPLHALNSPSMKPNFPVAFHRQSQRFRCLSGPAIFPAEGEGRLFQSLNHTTVIGSHQFWQQHVLTISHCQSPWVAVVPLIIIYYWQCYTAQSSVRAHSRLKPKH